MMSFFAVEDSGKYLNVEGDITDLDDDNSNEHNKVALRQKLPTIKTKNTHGKEEH